MDTNKGLRLLLRKDFHQHSLWKYDEDDDLYYPIFIPDDFPDRGRDLLIRSLFTTPLGTQFEGYVVGFKNIFSIAIFIDDQIYRFNKNLPDLSFEQFEALAKSLQLDYDSENIKDIFPLKYQTTIALENYKNISGEFNAFEKLKEERAKRWKKD